MNCLSLSLSRRSFLFSLGIASLSLGKVSSAYASAVPDRAAWLANDNRLGKTLSIVRQQIFVGELLEEAARQTGVNLSANRLDSADSMVLTICARKIALIDLMVGIWSLMSYQNAAWRWETEGGETTKIPLSYRLLRPVNARNFATNLRDEIEKNAVDTMEIELAALRDPTLIEKHAKDHPGLLSAKSPLIQSEDRAFSSLFNKDERLKIARGEMTKKIPIAEWTPEVFAYVKKRDEWATNLIKKDREKRFKAGQPVPPISPMPPPPQFVEFVRHKDSFPPVVIFRIDGVGGGAIVGSTAADKYWQDQYQSRWLMSGDTISDARNESRVVPTPKELTPPLDKEMNDPTLKFSPDTVIIGAKPRRPNEDYRLLNEFNQLTGIPVFARFVDDSTLFAHYDKPISDFVDELRKEKTRTVKWRDGMLLLTTILRDIKPSEKDLLIPWTVIHRFRQTVFTRSNAAPTLEDLCILAHDLSPEQFDALGVTRSLTPDSAFVDGGSEAGWHPLWVHLYRNESARRAISGNDGILLRDLPSNVRDTIAQQSERAGNRFAHYFIDAKYDAKSRQSIATFRCRIRLVDGLSEAEKRYRKPLTSTELVPRRVFFDILDTKGANDADSLPLFFWDVRDPIKLCTALESPFVVE